MASLVLEAASGKRPLLLVFLEERRNVEHRAFVREFRRVDDADVARRLAFLQHHGDGPDETDMY